MCGIAGIFNLNGKPVNFQVLEKMTHVQQHRGPDDQGFAGFSFEEKSIRPVIPGNAQSQINSFSGGLGFNRLSIIDLSMNGHQPMISQNGNVVIAYNGETYNAFEIKPELEKKGYRFKSKTDTEVLLNLYQENGIEKMLNRLNGMFAFCMVDLTLEKVFLARDHAGIKPLYWTKIGNTMLFASEIKAFLSYPEFKAEVNLNHFDEYLYYKYCGHDRTPFQNVYQVPPGYFMEVSKNKTKLVKYWNPDLNTTNLISRKEAVGQLENILNSCVKAQLIGDVKVGCQLSGGIDSSMITTYARHFFNANMDTFSIVFENVNVNEEKYMDQVISLTKPAAHKFLMTPEFFFENVVSATWHIDVPIPIPQAVGIKRLAKGASEHVTVLLSGEGSDELMGGYRQFYELAFKMKHQAWLWLFSKLPGKGAKIERQYLPGVLSEDYFYQHRSNVQIEEYREFRPEADLVKIFNQRKQMFQNHPDLLKTARLYDMKGWLGNTLNIQDKMTMAHSIENRVPFVDKNMIEFVFSLPSNYFIKASSNPFKVNAANHNTKITLKKLTSRYYNHDFVYRTKIGFNQPTGEYLAHQPMIEFVNDVVLPGIKKRGIIDFQKISTIWEHINKTNDFNGRLLFWSCFSFEIWAQVFIDQTLKP